MKDLKNIQTLKLEAKKKKMEIMSGKEKNLKSYIYLRKEIAKILTLETNNRIIEKLKKEETKK